ncbi:MAG: PcfJ domain-containing protein [Oscillospiraceae bacterium]|nr:PcfJ domain-containing protein [Oscillospiraceae bacterium]
MTSREKEIKRAEALTASSFKLTDSDMKKINGLFRAYIFRRKKTRELWTTCCHRHEVVPETEYSDDIYRIMNAEHHSETERIPTEHGPDYRTVKRDSEFYTKPCPFCGAGVFVKELGRTGKRDNLAEYQQVTIFRWHRKALWVKSLFLSKKYSENPDVIKGALVGNPNVSLHKVYRFKPGEAICAHKSYYSPKIDIVTEKPEKLPMQFFESFSDYGGSYFNEHTYFGVDEVEYSPFKYCGFNDFFDIYGSPMRFLAICCIFPRQVEMLMKTNMAQAVNDLVVGRRWNAAAFSWSEENPLASFGLSREEMKVYLESDKRIDSLVKYKQFKRAGIKCEIADFDELYRKISFIRSEPVLKHIKKLKIKPAKFMGYLHDESSTRVYAGFIAEMAIDEMAQYWIDYLDAAVFLGLDLKNSLVQMPKDLIRKHNETTQTVVDIKERETAQQNRELHLQQQVDLKRRKKKYEYSYGGFIFKMPTDPNEIIEEGKALKHCVGGYADRHMSGKLTLIFFRAEADPHQPLATIEMNGINMVQMYGYNNDVGVEKAKDKYAKILSPWLAWLKAGSKRDKKGQPVNPRRKVTHQKLEKVS